MARVNEITEKDIDQMFVDAVKWEPGQPENQSGPSAVLKSLKDQALRLRGKGAK